MSSGVFQALQIAASIVAEVYSDPERAENHSHETFEVAEIRPLSEHTAAAIYLKNTGKKAAFFFFYLPTKERWWHFVPTDSHILGMQAFAQVKAEIEAQNGLIEIGKNP